ncbi:MAG TPA: glucuronate isomerase [Thermomicrobiales bacterium]|nr:glucuronate isomerase [Thermomicrobiales bacterium]
MTDEWQLSPDRNFDPDPTQRSIARDLYSSVKDLPIISPHGHADPRLLADPQAQLGSPAELFIIPDHYVFRMLYSQGHQLEDLGVSPRDATTLETDHRRIWQRFAENFHLFRATPTGQWLRDELIEVFGIQEKLDGESAQRIYDELDAKLRQTSFSPRALFERFNIETLSTTDPATSALEHHQTLQEEGWGQKIRPTFRPDALLSVDNAGWQNSVEQFSNVSGVSIQDYSSLIQALEAHRQFFKRMGATATDHGVFTPHTHRLSDDEANAIFQRALSGKADATDTAEFSAHMLMEMARMSCEDGLVMQIHAGSFRNHNQGLYERFGPDTGSDIPVGVDWTRGMRELLNAYGGDPRFRLIVFTLDESTYGRELAPLAGHYPALLLGAPWWFYDSPNGMRRYLDTVIETAGIYNTAGFNDDTRAFASIPARHDMWRRVTCNWLAGQVATGIIDQEDASEMAADFAYHLAKRAYRLDAETA